MISKKEIERCRTSSELKSFVEKVRQKVGSDSDELKRACKREGLYKVFFDEILPLSQFAGLLYPAETKFLPVLGNQGYDVRVFDSEKSPIDRIEICLPHDGRAEAEDNRLVNDRGFGQIKIYDLGEQLAQLVTWITYTANKKSLKDYSDCTLVIVAAIEPPFEEELPTLEEQAAEIVRNLGKVNFQVKRAFLVVPELSKCFEIKGYQVCK